MPTNITPKTENLLNDYFMRQLLRENPLLQLEKYTKDLTALNLAQRLIEIDKAVDRVRIQFHEEKNRNAVNAEALFNLELFPRCNPITLKQQEQSEKYEAMKRSALSIYAIHKPSFFGVSTEKVSAARKFLSLIKKTEVTAEHFSREEFVALLEKHAMRKKNSALRNALEAAIGNDKLQALDATLLSKDIASIDITKQSDGNFLVVTRKKAAFLENGCA